MTTSHGRTRRRLLLLGYAIALPLMLVAGGADYLQLVTGVGLPDRPSSDRMLIVAHRGDLERYPENTLEAIRSAADLGVDGIEFDVHRSSDDTWWVLHDPDLESTTNETGSIGEVSDEVIAAAVITGGFGFDAAHHQTLRVPRLTAVLAALEGWDGMVVVDLQHARPRKVDDLVQLLAGRRALILCPDTATAAMVKQTDPHIRTAVRYGVTPSDAVDAWLAEAVHEATLGRVRAAPVPIITFFDEWRYGHDENAALRRAWAAGVQGFLTKSPRQALALNAKLETDR